MQTAADYRPSNAESSRGDGNTSRLPEMRVRRLNESAEQMLEIWEIPRGVTGLKYQPQAGPRLLEYSEVALCTADVASQNH